MMLFNFKLHLGYVAVDMTIVIFTVDYGNHCISVMTPNGALKLTIGNTGIYGSGDCHFTTQLPLLYEGM